MSYLTNINLQTPNNGFSEKSAFESGLLFLRDIVLFRTCHFSLFSAEPFRGGHQAKAKAKAEAEAEAEVEAEAEAKAKAEAKLSFYI